MRGILTKFKKMRNEVKNGTYTEQNGWNNKEIKRWLECNPIDLEKYRLDKYFYLTRENLNRSAIDDSEFSSKTKIILEKIGNSNTSRIAAIIEDMKNLNGDEVSDVFKVIIPKIEHGEIKSYVYRELFINFNAYRNKIIDALPASSKKVGISDIPSLKMMFKIDPNGLDEMLNKMVEKGTLSEDKLKEIKKVG